MFLSRQNFDIYLYVSYTFINDGRTVTRAMFKNPPAVKGNTTFQS